MDLRRSSRNHVKTQFLGVESRGTKRTMKLAKRGREMNLTPTIEQPNGPASDILAAELARLAEEVGSDIEPAAGVEPNPDLPRSGGEPPADQNVAVAVEVRDEDPGDLERMEVVADSTTDVLTVVNVTEDELERVEHHNSIVEENERIVIIEDSAPIINVEEDTYTIPPIVLENSSAGAGQLVHNETETIDLTDSPLSLVVRRGIIHPNPRSLHLLMNSPILYSNSRRNPDAGGQVSLPSVPEASSASGSELEARVPQDSMPGPSSTATSATGSSAPPACPICLDSFEEIRNSGNCSEY